MKRSRLLHNLIAWAVLALLTPVAMAADQEFVYHQATGKLTLGDTEVGQGYSGKGDAKNNPDKEALKNAGPIPRGLYTVGKAREYKKMPNCFDLTPDGHDARGRTEFLIHGDSKTDPGNASEGCIILSLDVRKKIAESGISKLRVVKD
jgi:hypothetical protein